MTTILEKRDDIINNISDYIDNNDVRCATTLFKNEYFTSVEFERTEQIHNGITYVFPKMKEDSSSRDIAKALVNRFLKENKPLGFKPEQLIDMEDTFHKTLLVEAVNAYTLNKDIMNINNRNNFDIFKFVEIFSKSGDTRELEKNGELAEEGFKAVLLGSIGCENKVNIPSMYAIASKMGTSEGKELIKKELGEDKQHRISSMLPRLKDVSIKNKNKLP